MKKLIALIVFVSLSPVSSLSHSSYGHRAALQGDLSKVEIKTHKLADNVYMLEGAGGNIGVTAGPDGLLMIDNQFAPLADKIRAALKQINPGRLRFVLNTHWHFDHTGGNIAFGPEATIIAHANVRKRMGAESRVLGNTVPPAPAVALPIVTYDMAASVHFNGEEVRVVHYPAGHTDGDSIILFTKSNVMHMGDAFFAGMFPFIDLDNGGDVEGLARNIADVIAKAPAGVKIIPGHGPVSTVEDLKTYHAMLQETTEIVRGRIAAGKTLEQVKAEGLPEKWKSWSWNFINTDMWLEIVYKSLTRGGEKKAASYRSFDLFDAGVFRRSTFGGLNL